MRDTTAALSLLALSVGIGWWLHPGAGLAVAGALVLTGLVASHVFGWTAPPEVKEEKE